MPRLQATVPAGAPSNALLRVRLPDGTEVKVRVPDGLSPGDEFQFEVSTLGEIINTTIPTKKDVAAAANTSGKLKSKNPKKKRHHDNASATNNKGSHVHPNRTPLFISVCLDLYQKLHQALTQDHPIIEDQPRVSFALNKSSPNTANQPTSFNERKRNVVNYYLGFLDRDIINANDFGMALAVGMFIGLSIVAGFLAGVLWVTPVE